MIDPIIFSFRLGNFEFALRWYSVIAVSSLLLGAWLAERQLRRRGENADHLWDGLIWAIPAGIVGARAWYVLNDIFGGGAYYLDNPVQIFNLPQGGLHIYGAFLLGGIAFYLYARRNKVDMRLILDSVAPSMLIAQGTARLGNFINQELYGPPTTLPWGIPIAPAYRIPPWNDLTRFPESTRFHPTFAYEMLWNLVAGSLLLWLSNRFKDKVRPGAVFFAWLILAGVGRVIIETWRPDQPRIPGTGLSYSRLVAASMAVVGTLLMLVRYGVLRIPFKLGGETYTIAPSKAPEAKNSESRE